MRELHQSTERERERVMEGGEAGERVGWGAKEERRGVERRGKERRVGRGGEEPGSKPVHIQWMKNQSSVELSDSTWKVEENEAMPSKF